MDNPSTADLPTVATIIGCPEQLSDTKGLVAMPLGVPGGEASEEAIQKVLLGNFCGNFMTKKEKDFIHCEVCNITCTGEVAFKAHTSGAKHTKKVKERDQNGKCKLPPFIIEDPLTKNYECSLCQVKLNAKNQITAHVAGLKHKTRLGPNEKLYSAVPRNMSVGQDLSASLLYCPTCDVHANSSLQMDQHMASAKHVNRVNGGMNMGLPSRRTFGTAGASGISSMPAARFTPYSYKEREYDKTDRREQFRRERSYGDSRNGYELLRGDNQRDSYDNSRGFARPFDPRESQDYSREMNRGSFHTRECFNHSRDERGGVWIRERPVENREYYPNYFETRNEYFTDSTNYCTRRNGEMYDNNRLPPVTPRLSQEPVGYSF